MQIMSNPHRGRGGYPNGNARGGQNHWQQRSQAQDVQREAMNGNGHAAASKPPTGRGESGPQILPRGQGAPRGFAGRGRGFNPERGRGFVRGFRGRGGRGQAPPVTS